MDDIVKKTANSSRGLKKTPRHIKFVAWDDSRPPDKYVYELGGGIAWGPDYKKAKRFDSIEDARKQVARLGGVDPEKFAFGSIGEGKKRSKVL